MNLIPDCDDLKMEIEELKNKITLLDIKPGFRHIIDHFGINFYIFYKNDLQDNDILAKETEEGIDLFIPGQINKKIIKPVLLYKIMQFSIKIKEKESRKDIKEEFFTDAFPNFDEAADYFVSEAMNMNAGRIGISYAKRLNCKLEFMVYLCNFGSKIME